MRARVILCRTTNKKDGVTSRCWQMRSIKLLSMWWWISRNLEWREHRAHRVNRGMSDAPTQVQELEMVGLRMGYSARNQHASGWLREHVFRSMFSVVPPSSPTPLNTYCWPFCLWFWCNLSLEISSKYIALKLPKEIDVPDVWVQPARACVQPTASALVRQCIHRPADLVAPLRTCHPAQILLCEPAATWARASACHCHPCYTFLHTIHIMYINTVVRKLNIIIREWTGREKCKRNGENYGIYLMWVVCKQISAHFVCTRHRSTQGISQWWAWQQT